MITRRGLPTLLRCLGVALGMVVFTTAAHTLPISYLRLVPEADYLHRELAFNPFVLASVKGGHQQLAQLDPQSRKATNQPPAEQPPKAAPATPHRRAALGLVLLVATVLLAVLGAALLWVLRKHFIQ